MNFSREHPCKIRLIERVRLSGQGSAKDIYRLVFDAKELDYLPGDSLAIFPINDPLEVENVLKLLHFDGSEPVNIRGETLTIREALTKKFCITHLPKRFISAFLEHLNPEEGEQFQQIFSDEHEDQYSLIELLEHFKNVRLSLEELCRSLKRTAPRLYSIASSRSMQGGKIHLIVNTVSYKNFLGNTRCGVVSQFLNHRLKIGDHVDGYISSSSFKLPLNLETDVIMIGPGTGLAPFMSFLYELEAKKRSNLKTGRTWLFFGDQHADTDFIERDELSRLLENGVLNRLDLAFSRDQKEKIYVQDRMWESRKEFWDWIEKGANIYVCGTASRMAVDVESMLKRIAIACGHQYDGSNFDDESATKWLSDLRSNGRYQRDVY